MDDETQCDFGDSDDEGENSDEEDTTDDEEFDDGCDDVCENDTDCMQWALTEFDFCNFSSCYDSCTYETTYC
jgi:hypothetical protein